MLVVHEFSCMLQLAAGPIAFHSWGNQRAHVRLRLARAPKSQPRPHQAAWTQKAAMTAKRKLRLGQGCIRVRSTNASLSQRKQASERSGEFHTLTHDAGYWMWKGMHKIRYQRSGTTGEAVVCGLRNVTGTTASRRTPQHICTEWVKTADLGAGTWFRRQCGSLEEEYGRAWQATPHVCDWFARYGTQAFEVSVLNLCFHFTRPPVPCNVLLRKTQKCAIMCMRIFPSVCVYEYACLHKWNSYSSFHSGMTFT